MTPRDLLAEELLIFLPDLHGTELEALLNMAERLFAQGWNLRGRFFAGDPSVTGVNPYGVTVPQFEVPC